MGYPDPVEAAPWVDTPSLAAVPRRAPRLWRGAVRRRSLRARGSVPARPPDATRGGRSAGHAAADRARGADVTVLRGHPRGDGRDARGEAPRARCGTTASRRRDHRVQRLTESASELRAPGDGARLLPLPGQDAADRGPVRIPRQRARARVAVPVGLRHPAVRRRGGRGHLRGDAGPVRAWNRPAGSGRLDRVALDCPVLDLAVRRPAPPPTTSGRSPVGACCAIPSARARSRWREGVPSSPRWPTCGPRCAPPTSAKGPRRSAFAACARSLDQLQTVGSGMRQIRRCSASPPRRGFPWPRTARQAPVSLRPGRAALAVARRLAQRDSGGPRPAARIPDVGQPDLAAAPGSWNAQADQPVLQRAAIAGLAGGVARRALGERGHADPADARVGQGTLARLHTRLARLGALEALARHAGERGAARAVGARLADRGGLHADTYLAHRLPTHTAAALRRVEAPLPVTQRARGETAQIEHRATEQRLGRRRSGRSGARPDFSAAPYTTPGRPITPLHRCSTLARHPASSPNEAPITKSEHAAKRAQSAAAKGTQAARASLAPVSFPASVVRRSRIPTSTRAGRGRREPGDAYSEPTTGSRRSSSTPCPSARRWSRRAAPGAHRCRRSLLRCRRRRPTATTPPRCVATRLASRRCRGFPGAGGIDARWRPGVDGMEARPS